ncbi:MAG: helix-turn-helix domain-containing protein [Rhizobacter sp.]
MPAKAPALNQALQLQLALLGERIRAARLRRGRTAEAVAKDAGITRVTLARLEAGDSAVSMGNLMKVLAVLGLDGEAEAIGADVNLAARVPAGEIPLRRVPPRIRLKHYPQLRGLAWHIRDDEAELTPEEAFELYERNWRYLDKEAILPREHALIERLKQNVGQGVMLV